MISKPFLKIFLFSVAFFVATGSLSAFNISTGPVFFMGEDIIHPQGMVITVNEVSRKSFTGGLGVSGKKENLTINLTMLNSGSKDHVVNIMEDFVLELGSRIYKPIKDDYSRVSLDEVSIGATTQSRVNVSFRVDSQDNQTPELLFNLDGSVVRIVCDEELGKIVTSSDISTTDKDNVAKAAKLLIEAGRLTAAKNLCESVLVRNTSDSQFLILMTKIYRSIGEEEEAGYYLKKIDVTKMRGPEEAEEAAYMAVDVGYSDIGLDILIPFNEAGLLNNEQKTLLARCYYYEGEYRKAENILSNLLDTGFADEKVYFSMGNVYNKLRDNDRAIFYWEKALEINPEHSEALFNIGVGHLNKNDIPRARQYWERVLRSSPDSATLAAAEEALKGTEF